MPNFNQYIQCGHLADDPKLSYLPSQTPVVEFCVASNERWKDKDGNQRERKLFWTWKSFGKQAEVIAKFFTKGKPILCRGPILQDDWEDREGKKRRTYTAKVDSFEFMDSGGTKEQAAPAPTSVDQQPVDESDLIPF